MTERAVQDLVTYTVTVEKDDIDVLGHVNNRVYLRWVEEAAVHASDVNGWSTKDYIDFGAAWMAREHWIEYLRPCALGDVITIHTWVQYHKGGLCLRRYSMKNGEKLCCVAATQWVFVDLKTRRAVDCPPEVNDCFKVVSPEDERLKALGIARCVRFTPLGMVAA